MYLPPQSKGFFIVNIVPRPKLCPLEVTSVPDLKAMQASKMLRKSQVSHSSLRERENKANKLW